MKPTDANNCAKYDQKKQHKLGTGSKPLKRRFYMPTLCYFTTTKSLVFVDLTQNLLKPFT